MAKKIKKGLDFLDKLDIINLLKRTDVKTTDIYSLKDCLYFEWFLNEKNPNKYSLDDVLVFLTEQTLKCMTKDFSKSLFMKYLYVVGQFIHDHLKFEDEKLIKIEPLANSLYLEAKKIKIEFENFKINNQEKYNNLSEEEIKIINELIDYIEDNLAQVMPEMNNEEETNNTSLNILQELNDKIKELEKKIKELENNNQSLESKNKKLEKNETKQKEEIQKLKQELQSLNNEKKKIENIQANNENIDNLINEINELNKLIEQLKKEKEQLLQTEKKYKDLHEIWSKLKETYNELEIKYAKLEKRFIKQNKKYNELLNNPNQTEEEKLKQKLNETRDLLRDAKKDYRDLSKEYDSYRQVNKPDVITAEDVTNRHIRDIIIENLFTNNYNIHKLINILKNKGYEITTNDLYKQLNIIKKEIKIITTEYSTKGPIFGIDKKFQKGCELNIKLPYNQTSNILILSNTLLNRNVEELKKLFNDIYDYCIKNNINYIFSIGNLFDIKSNLLSISEFKNIQKQLELVIENYPTESSINNILLGGSNDLILVNHGLNPLEYLANERIDFYNLGYKNGQITFSSPENRILLSESDISLKESNQRDKILEYLNNYKYKYLLKILGSNYSSVIDTTNNFITVPPLYNSEILNGGIELNLSMNSNGEIKEIRCIPLIIDDILIPTSHIYLKK